jgi:hypothetical protein
VHAPPTDHVHCVTQCRAKPQLLESQAAAASQLIPKNDSQTNNSCSLIVNPSPSPTSPATSNVTTTTTFQLSHCAALWLTHRELLPGLGVEPHHAVHLVLRGLCGDVSAPLLRHHVDQHGAHSVSSLHLCVCVCGGGGGGEHGMNARVVLCATLCWQCCERGQTRDVAIKFINTTTR